jgi:hypothetical protein
VSDTGTVAGLGTTALFTMLALGAFHGINPGMGWLFAVALGIQERSSVAVGRSLVPIALGHGLAIGAVVLFGVLLGTVIPLAYLKLGVALIMLGFGAHCLLRQRHPRGGGMRVGFCDLTSWSFFMASAHGAGFMLLPVLLGSSTEVAHVAHAGSGMDAHSFATPLAGLIATAAHTMAYLAVTGLVAWVVYKKLGLALLRKAWINLHLIWAVALIVSGAFTLLL